MEIKMKQLNAERGTEKMSIFEHARCPEKTANPARRALLQALGSSLVLSACGGATAWIGPSGSMQPIKVRMHNDLGHQWVEATLDGRTVRLALDTGADFSVLTPAAAERLGYTLSKAWVAGSGAEGATVVARWTSIPDFAIGNAHLRSSIVYVLPLPNEFAYDGIVGMNFFKSFAPRFDYAAGELTLQLADGFVAPSGVSALPVRLDGAGKVLVEARIAEVAGWFSLDTGKQSALAIFRPSVERYRRREVLAPSVRMVTGAGVGGLTRGDYVRASEFVLGEHRLRGVVTSLSLAKSGLYGSDAWMGNIGAEILRRFTMTLDVAGRRLFLEPNGSFSEPFRGPSTGLAYSLVEGGFEVVDVVADSPAAAAGVAIGDRIVSCNDRPVTATNYLHLRHANRGAVGSTMRLRLRSASHVERDVQIVLRELV
jgi:clan AA aspartic protease (TIGR02281 family)